MEFRVGDVFEDREIIRVIKAPAPGREQSLPPTSGLRPRQHAGAKRFRSPMRQGALTNGHALGSIPEGLGDFTSSRAAKRQKVDDSDPDQPVPSSEQPQRDGGVYMANGRSSPENDGVDAGNWFAGANGATVRLTARTSCFGACSGGFRPTSRIRASSLYHIYTSS